MLKFPKEFMRLYIVRHGQSFANVGREKESVNSPLTDLGKQQAEDAGKFFRDMPDFQFDKVFLSPQIRARETCRLLNPNTKTPPQVRDMLIEVFNVENDDPVRRSHKLMHWVLDLAADERNKNVLFVAHANIIGRMMNAFHRIQGDMPRFYPRLGNARTAVLMIPRSPDECVILYALNLTLEDAIKNTPVLFP